MTRTIDEIKAYYGELLETFNKLEGDSKNDDWVGEQVKEAWLLLDYINTLEAQVQATREWESVENPPLLAKREEWSSHVNTDWGTEYDGGEYYESNPLELLAIGQGAYWVDGDKSLFEIEHYKVVGWRYLKEQP